MNKWKYMKKYDSKWSENIRKNMIQNEKICLDIGVAFIEENIEKVRESCFR